MLSVYVHIPFCVKKCRYCGFYSTSYEEKTADFFLDAVSREIESFKAILQARKVNSIYIGGGTPTALSLKQMGILFSLLDRHVQTASDTEITVEANPNTISGEMLDFLLRSGVTRISLGIQSFSDVVLSKLGRSHSSDDALHAVLAAQRAGFKNVGIDLILGIPDQTIEDWSKTVERAVSLKPDHISAYILSIEPGSCLDEDVRAGRMMMPSEEIIETMYKTAVTRLSAAGYIQYEISNFSLPGCECRHNKNYWQRGEYLGLGPSAWSFLGNMRFSNIANTSEYISRIGRGESAVAFSEHLSDSDAAFETFLLGLRMREGISISSFCGLLNKQKSDDLRAHTAACRDAGLLQIEGDTIKLTTKGMLLSNEVINRLMS